MRDLEKIGRECIRDLEAINYEFPKRIRFIASGRMKKTWGTCTTYLSRDYTDIKIATFLLQDDVEEKQLRQTIYHELAHAIDNNEHGHDREWKMIADDISDCYNMDIQRYCTKEEITSLKSTEMYKDLRKKYVCRCNSCGKEHYRYGYRAPRWYTHPQNYHCRCGGNLIIAL